MRSFIVLLTLGTLRLSISAYAQSPDRNYVLTRTYKQINLVEANGNTYAGTPAQVNTQINYFNGLGQPTQHVAAYAGPAYQDLVIRTEYDNQFRPTKTYLPVPAPNNNGQFVTNPNGSYYNNTSLVCTPTTDYFTQSLYEAAPLSRMSESKAPGVTTGIRTTYMTNSASSVVRYGVSGTGLRAISNAGFYGANTLTYTETKDEDNHTVQEHRDSYNRVVLKRVVLSNGNLDTYYVYDEGSNLRAVLQPMYQSEASVDKFAFLYEYNNRGLLVKKKVPGAGESSLSYDGRDRLTSIIDGKGQTFYYQYDELNRQTEMGLVVANTNTPLTYMYYDNYNYGAFAGFDNELNLDPTQHFVTTSQMNNRNGLVTGSSARVLNVDGSYGSWLQTVNYYDSKGRPIQTVRQLYGLQGSAYERVSYQLDFAGKPILERTTQYTGSTTYRVEKTFSYDQADRLTRTEHKIYENDLGTPKKTYVHHQLAYNEVGQLKQKQLHGAMQTLTYKYTSRGWLCDLRNNGGVGFNVTLNYNANGNIHDMDSGTNSQFGGTAIYSYDGANRLTGYQTGWGFEGNAESNISYDKNGNLLTLTRTNRVAGVGDFIIDALTYSYQGNQLWQVEDGANDAGRPERGFINGASSATEMAYDGNGNLTKDDNRGIGAGGILYNALDLPRQVIQSGQTVQYVYDGAGTKRRMLAPGGVATTYEGAFEYNANGTLLRVALEEGQLVRNAGTGAYSVEYYYKDHLDNVRMVQADNGAVVQQTEYYAFGLAVARGNTATTNQYFYNGKEQQPVMGWLDYGARMYDKTLGRWLSMDPLSEVSRRWSPYVYTYNNPVRFIDPDGVLANDADGMRQTGQDVAAEAQERSEYQYSNGYQMLSSGQETASVLHEGVFHNVGGSSAQGDGPGKGRKGQVSGGIRAANMPGTGIRKNADGELESYSTQTNRVPNEGYNDPFLSIIDFMYGTNLSGINNGQHPDYIGGGAPSFGLGKIGNIASHAEFRLALTATRTATADRVGKQGFTLVGYQFQKHVGRGNPTLESFIPQGATRNQATWNRAGYEAYKAIMRAPGSFQNDGMFLKKLLPDGTGIFLQHNYKFKGFLNPQ